MKFVINTSVVRQHEDFIWLYERISKNYAGLIIPPAPIFDLGELNLTVATHQLFLVRLAIHPLFGQDRDFSVFLRYDDRELWDEYKKTKNCENLKEINMPSIHEAVCYKETLPTIDCSGPEFRRLYNRGPEHNDKVTICYDVWKSEFSVGRYKIFEERKRYSHQLPQWPFFYWDDAITENDRRRKLIRRMEDLGSDIQAETVLQTLTLDVVQSSAIEEEILDPKEVRSSIENNANNGIVDMILDATRNFENNLTEERLFEWHSALFNRPISAYRTGQVQVVSGSIGREIIHFQAPDADIVKQEMNTFLRWFNGPDIIDPVIKAAVSHLWFVTIHPFGDGNGRTARAIADMQLARADGSSKRFYSMSDQIFKRRKSYYKVLENTQRGLDITEWLTWFLDCLDESLSAADKRLEGKLKKILFWKNHRPDQFNDRQKHVLDKLLGDFYGKLTLAKWSKMTKCSLYIAKYDIMDLLRKKVLIEEADERYALKEE